MRYNHYLPLCCCLIYLSLFLQPSEQLYICIFDVTGVEILLTKEIGCKLRTKNVLSSTLPLCHDERRWKTIHCEAHKTTNHILYSSTHTVQCFVQLLKASLRSNYRFKSICLHNSLKKHRPLTCCFVSSHISMFTACMSAHMCVHMCSCFYWKYSCNLLALANRCRTVPLNPSCLFNLSYSTESLVSDHIGLKTTLLSLAPYIHPSLPL